MNEVNERAPRRLTRVRARVSERTSERTAPLEPPHPRARGYRTDWGRRASGRAPVRPLRCRFVVDIGRTGAPAPGRPIVISRFSLLVWSTRPARAGRRAQARGSAAAPPGLAALARIAHSLRFAVDIEHITKAWSETRCAASDVKTKGVHRGLLCVPPWTPFAVKVVHHGLLSAVWRGREEPVHSAAVSAPALTRARRGKHDAPCPRVGVDPTFVFRFSDRLRDRGRQGWHP